MPIDMLKSLNRITTKPTGHINEVFNNLDDLVNLMKLKDQACTFERGKEYDDALTKYEQLLELQIRDLGDEHVETLETMDCIMRCIEEIDRGEAGVIDVEVEDVATAVVAVSLFEEGRVEDSFTTTQTLLDEVRGADDSLATVEDRLEKTKVGFGAEHPQTLVAMNNLGHSLKKEKRYDEALTTFETVLEKRSVVLGSEHEETLNTMNSIAFLLKNLDRPLEAIAMYETVAAKRGNSLGEEHPDTLTTMHVLACELSNLERHKEALPIFELVSHRRSRIIGEAHRDTLNAMYWAAYELFKLERPGEALPLFSKVLGLRARVLGAEHPHTLLTMDYLAGCYSSLFMHDEAIVVLERLIEIRTRVLETGWKHPDVLQGMQKLVWELYVIKRYSDAKRIAQRGIVIARLWGSESQSNKFVNLMTQIQGDELNAQKKVTAELTEKKRVLQASLDKSHAINGKAAAVAATKKWSQKPPTTGADFDSLMKDFGVGEYKPGAVATTSTSTDKGGVGTKKKGKK
jgi:tetratricopeptide (TPR) repeat protein